MSELAEVTCGQCQSFSSNGHYDDFGDNGTCSVWDEKLAQRESIVINSAFFNYELGGRPLSDEAPRKCKKFNGKYSFVVGD